MKKFLTLFVILGITSCTNETTDSEIVSIDKDKTYNWRLVTSWPKNYPGLGMAPERIADLVEDAEVRTNKRSEGVFFASVTFIRKTTQGIGVVAAGLLLTYSEFPEGLTPDQVPVSVVHDLATIYVPVVILLWSLMILCISMYQVDRTKHEENLQTLGRG